MHTKDTGAEKQPTVVGWRGDASAALCSGSAVNTCSAGSQCSNHSVFTWAEGQAGLQVRVTLQRAAGMAFDLARAWGAG